MLSLSANAAVATVGEAVVTDANAVNAAAAVTAERR